MSKPTEAVRSLLSNVVLMVNSPMTDADRQAEQVLEDLLSDVYPSHQFERGSADVRNMTPPWLFVNGSVCLDLQSIQRFAQTVRSCT